MTTQQRSGKLYTGIMSYPMASNDEYRIQSRYPIRVQHVDKFGSRRSGVGFCCFLRLPSVFSRNITCSTISTSSGVKASQTVIQRAQRVGWMDINSKQSSPENKLWRSIIRIIRFIVDSWSRTKKIFFNGSEAPLCREKKDSKSGSISQKIQRRVAFIIRLSL